MKNLKLIQNFTTAALLTIFTPTLVNATTTLSPEMEKDGFSVLTNFSDTEMASIDSLSNREMSEVRGEFFNFGINIAVLPQINVCLFCFNSTQINNGSIVGVNMLE